MTGPGKCIVCNQPFKPGDRLQAFLRCPEEPDGSWTNAVEVDSGFQDRVKQVGGAVKRKHEGC